MRWLFILFVPAVLALARPALADFPAATYLACAEVMPEHRDRLAKAAEVTTGKDHATLPTSLTSSRSRMFCSTVVVDALRLTGSVAPPAARK